MNTKKTDREALVKKVREAKNQPKSKTMEKKLGKQKNGAKFGKVNFSG